jgi:hypothetical protein
LPEDLVPLELPALAGDVWGWYCELAGRRGGGFGPLPIGWSDLESWARIRGVALSGWDLECLAALEAAWFRARGK